MRNYVEKYINSKLLYVKVNDIQQSSSTKDYVPSDDSVLYSEEQPLPEADEVDTNPNQLRIKELNETIYGKAEHEKKGRMKGSRNLQWSEIKTFYTKEE